MHKVGKPDRHVQPDPATTFFLHFVRSRGQAVPAPKGAGSSASYKKVIKVIPLASQCPTLPCKLGGYESVFPGSWSLSPQFNAEISKILSFRPEKSRFRYSKAGTKQKLGKQKFADFRIKMAFSLLGNETLSKKLIF
jgi:hypothetical protein